MTFRRRITMVSAAAVAVSILLAFALTYLLTSNQLHSQIDKQLQDRAFLRPRDFQFLAPPRSASLRAALGHIPSGALYKLRALKQGRPGGVLITSVKGTPSLANPFGDPRPNQVRGYQQVIDSSGKVIVSSAGKFTLPVDAATRKLARERGKAFFQNATVKGIHLRVLSESLRPGFAIQYAQPLTEVDNLLGNLRLILALLLVGGVALAALLGRVIARAAVAPIRRLTQATEHVTATRDLSRRIEPASEDEIGRLAVSFNAMMDALGRSMSALDASVHAQRQLVADASHELRTPITSMRTNIEILQQTDETDGPERQRILTDVVGQIEELTLLMNDLIDLARGDQPHNQTEDVRLDALIVEAIERARRHAPDTEFLLDLQPTVIAGIPARLDRAVSNLLENAAKYSPPGAPVHVALRDSQLVVRDHGPGIHSDDLPHVFDRFYRGAEARAQPGSGLGLAIVRQVVEQHGGTVSAEPATDGGTLIRVCLPGEIPSYEQEPLQAQSSVQVD